MKTPTSTLAVIQPQHVPEVVSVLRDMLERAEAGHVYSIAVAGQMREGGTASAYYVGGGDVAHLYTAMARVQSRLLAEGGAA